MKLTQIAQNLLGALAQGDYEGAVAFVSEDFVCVESDGMPYAGEYLGKAGFLELMGKLFSTFNGFELIDTTEDGESIILQVTMMHTSDRGTFRMPLSELWHFRDGLLLEAIPFYFDPPMTKRFVAGEMPKVAKEAIHRKMEASRGDRDRNVATVTAILQKAAAGDWDGINVELDEQFHVVEADALPYAGIYRGKQGFPDVMRALTATWQNFSFSIDEVVADGRRVFMIQTLRGNVGGRDLTTELAEMWEIEDGKVVRVVPFYFDPAPIAASFAAGRAQGTAPQPASAN